jgi:4-amino-4-deoxy-L-arabinose transferase-like glycosyltransferase
MPDDKKIQRLLWFIIALSFIVRAFIAGFIEFGNDEVYYWTYAKFPDLSHFDHPPMVGLMVQLFTLNLHFDSEFFIRLAAVVIGSASTFLIYLTGRVIKDALTGFYAALLYTASIYCFIISGTFILPDSPQVFFWLLSLYLLCRCLPDKTLSKESRKLLLLAGVTIGLALLSKYHSVFLLFGTFLYMLFYNRKWFIARETWLALLIAVVVFSPVILWNFNNDFISFTFHEERIEPVSRVIRWNYFFTEIAGQFFYNNPVNFVIIAGAFIALIRGRKILDKEYLRLILLISLPLALIFTVFSLFRPTLPHWTGPAYLGFILLAAAYLREISSKKTRIRLFPVPVCVALVFIFVVVIGGSLQINYGLIPFQRWKMDDPAAQLYGWNQLGDKFSVIVKKDEAKGTMIKSSPVLTFRWFPAANFDYYLARPLDKKVYAIGELERIHKYFWINRIRGPLLKGSNAYYIGLSDDYQDPAGLYGTMFDSIRPADTIRIVRGNDVIRKAYIFRLIGLKKSLTFGL